MMDIIKKIVCLLGCCFCLQYTVYSQQIRNENVYDVKSVSEKENPEETKDYRRFVDEPDSVASWNPWTNVNACSVTCGGSGFVQRLRECSTGVKSDCEIIGGRWYDIALCKSGPCTASWLEWSAPSSCSASCGLGVTARLRNCSTHQNHDCPGNAYEIVGCSVGDCPTTTQPTTTTTKIVGIWSEWALQVRCSKTCGAGYGERTRTCSTNRNDDCTGRAWEVNTCNQGDCVVDGYWSDWEAWGGCSSTCGVGSKLRSRNCFYPDPTNKGKACDGVNYETQPCNPAVCPVDGTWGEWGAYAECSASCDAGLKLRTRNCTFPSDAPHGKFCESNSFNTVYCSDKVCPGDGAWTTWSSWSDCTATCNGGLSFRARACDFPPGRPHGANCTGDNVDHMACNVNKCAVDGVFTDWSSWTQCTHTCDGGIASRRRVCVYYGADAPHGADCVGDKLEIQHCGADACPVDGIWGAWVPWTQCSQTCGTGLTSRNRTCDYRPPTSPHGKPCDGDGYVRQLCNTDLCPVDAKWSEWSRFSACNKPCGGGQRTRTRSCTVDPVAPLGRNCTGSSEIVEDCNMVVCPVNGTLTSWAAWSVCTVSCDGGTHYRTRQCFFPLLVPHGADCVGDLREDTACNESPCPTTTQPTTTTTEATVDGHWSAWDPWSTCTKTCGTGSQARARTCTYPDHTLHGVYCKGDTNQTRDCNTDNCPVDGKWTDWSTYSRCSVSCENGTHSRNRTCSFDPRYPKGDNCSGVDFESGTCYTGSKCPVDGTWSSWEAWTSCSKTCGNGTQGRLRTCDFPADTPHGTPCTGDSHQNQTCGTDLCPVDGVFGEWSNWTDCTVSCGNGTKTRNRTCDFTPGSPHGLDCVGDLYLTHSCNTQLCPVDGVWTEWASWDGCSKTCDTGTQSRRRRCQYIKDTPHGDKCPGASKEQKNCNTGKCPVDGHWSGWTSWSTCSVSCENGTHIRSHVCTFVDGFPHGSDCVGPANETEACNDGACPVDGIWSAWTTWSPCTVSCANGTSSRGRTCDFTDGHPHGQNCSGPSDETMTCNTQLCPVDGTFGAWSNWTSCSITCGGGLHTSDRQCEFDAVAPHGENCTGNFNETESCNDNKCPVDGVWSPWSNFTQCTQTCGNGTQFRNRRCVFQDGVPHGNNCTGSSVEQQECQTNLCPIDGRFTEWGNWSECSISCDNGTQSRNRRCEYSDVAPKGDPCVGDFKEARECNTDPCPIDGHWSGWSKYDACSKVCGTGLHARNRTCIFHDPAPHGAQCFGNVTETGDCNTDLCPVDGSWSAWNEWNKCTTTCGKGTQLRGRICEFQSGVPKGKNCTGDVSEARDCNTTPCPVDGILSAWSDWTKCSYTCGDGEQFRTRKCNFPDGGIPRGDNCTGALDETQKCNLKMCPVDGVWSVWSNYTQCTQTCGNGTHVRDRNCDFPPGVEHGQNCTGMATEQQVCQTNVCPVDGSWGPWSDFSSCTKSCGNGTSTRKRKCEYTPAVAPHGTKCPGDADEVKSCNATECPQDAIWSNWSDWSNCSVTCGGGNQTRDRKCTWPSSVHGADCTDGPIDSQTCNSDKCPVDGHWSPWSNWTACSVSCNIGQQHKNRTCIYADDAPHGVTCPGHNSATQFCSPGLCAVDGIWSMWTGFGACSATCGNGTQERMRKCAFPVPGAPHGDNCTGDETISQPCFLTYCLVDGSWGDWAAWSDCSASCGDSDKYRTRACEFNDTEHPGADCIGVANETSHCNLGSCPVDGVWQSWLSWSSCSVTCDGGSRNRNRTCYFPSDVPPGNLCPGNGTDQATCNAVACPTTTLPPTTMLTQTSQAHTTHEKTTTALPPTTMLIQTSKAHTTHEKTTTTPTTTTAASTTATAASTTATTASTTATTAAPKVTTTELAVPRSCSVCHGPPFVCESLKAPAECPIGLSYCINEITNRGDGSRLVNRRCGTRKECYDGWFVNYSAVDKCTNFDEKFIYTNDFYCEFCCDSDNCNDRVNPPQKFFPE